MVRKSFMLVGGEPSGDILGAELVPCLRERMTEIEGVHGPDSQPLRTSLVPEFYGAGGPRMAAAGVQLAVEMTQHSVVGLWEVIKKYQFFSRLMRQLSQMAIRRQPDVIVCIDFSGFNLRLAHRIRQHVRSLQGTFGNWRPRIVQYVSPQVWASRPERALRMAEDVDLLLSILPFEAEWYAQRAPKLRVTFVGHPLVERHAVSEPAVLPDGSRAAVGPSASAMVLLLPGSRAAELTRHLPVMLGAVAQLRSARPSLRARMVVPSETFSQLARTFQLPPNLEIQVGELAQSLQQADVAIASTGTVTLECAWFGVPTVAIYRTSRLTYEIGKRLIQVKHMAMPNLLAGEELFPEFIQDAATPANIAAAIAELLDDTARRALIRAQLAKIVQSLGSPGASRRAADAIVALLESEPRQIRASSR
jgi:lipid-A-disaccharide synthase